MATTIFSDFARNNALITNLKQFGINSNYDDYLALVLLACGGIGYLTKGCFWDRQDPNYYKWFERPQEAFQNGITAQNRTKNIAERLDQTQQDMVIFWGSQSGTAENFANRLARDCHQRFKINALIADISDYDPETIALIPQNKLVIFLLSTFGEGDPSDNTTNFVKWLELENSSLQNLRYAAFGLGNSNYKYYNKVVEIVVKALDRLGAKSLIPFGKADDAITGKTEEDFLDWKENLFRFFNKSLGIQEHQPMYEPTITIVEDDSMESIDLFNGEPIPQKLVRKAAALTSPVGALLIKESHELFKNPNPERSCIHMELDLSTTSEIKYKTGDHLVVWPINPIQEVNLLLEILGLKSKRMIPLTILSLDPINTKVNIPTPTTVMALFQNYKDICAPVSRETVLALVQFAPSPESKSLLLSLGKTKEAYSTYLASNYITFGRLLQYTSTSWSSLPLSFVIESLPSMIPRYYSISSSSIMSPRKASITAIISKTPLSSNSKIKIPGLTSSYLSALCNQSISTDYSFLESGTKLHAQIRRSTFKLPINTIRPTIMIAAGTGIAPFRGFLQEMARLKTMGKEIGPIMLFIGARNESEYLYREEMEALTGGMLEKELTIITAFSRVPNQAKVYVQDRVMEKKEMVYRFIFEEDATVFICGSSSMAREVVQRFGGYIQSEKNWTDLELKAWNERQKKTKRWQEDVWG